MDKQNNNQNDKLICIVVLLIIIVVIYMIFFDNSYHYDHYERMSNSDSKFVIRFRTNWGNPATKNIINYPEPPKEEAPHTGNMFLIVHNKNYYPFKLGEYASKGVANSSMYGINDDLINEVKNQRNNYYQYYTANVLQTPGTYQFTVTANNDYPYMSFVTMIAPSPDWFTAISSINLLNIQKSKTIPIYAYDAGTDKGTKFITFPKHPLMNKKPISYLTSGEMFPNGISTKNIPPFAYIDITRIS
jgi:hypothetical protein